MMEGFWRNACRCRLVNCSLVAASAKSPGQYAGLRRFRGVPIRGCSGRGAGSRAPGRGAWGVGAPLANSFWVLNISPSLRYDGRTEKKISEK